MTKRLEGKVAIITGAARGQGAAEARMFVAEGARVVLTDVDDSGAALANELGGNTVFVHHDVASSGDWATVVATTEREFGRVDALINNAGIYDPSTLSATSEQLFERLWRINELGVFLGMQAVTQVMARQGSGSIVNISSAAALRGMPAFFAYGTSKWGVRGMTKYAAAALAEQQIRVNSVHPGIIETPMLDGNPKEINDRMVDMIPLKRRGQPEEVASLVLFLASDESRFITGAEISIDGGASM